MLIGACLACVVCAAPGDVVQLFPVRPVAWLDQVDPGNPPPVNRRGKEQPDMTGTTIIIVSTVVVVVAIDVFLAVTDRPTISQTVWSASKKYPIIPLAVGVLIGHMFWRN